MRNTLLGAWQGNLITEREYYEMRLWEAVRRRYRSVDFILGKLQDLSKPVTQAAEGHAATGPGTMKGRGEL